MVFALNNCNIFLTIPYKTLKKIQNCIEKIAKTLNLLLHDIEIESLRNKFIHYYHKIFLSISLFLKKQVN